MKNTRLEMENNLSDKYTMNTKTGFYTRRPLKLSIPIFITIIYNQIE